MGDHVHVLISIPPKYSVSQVVGYIKGKSAIHIARTYAGKRHNFIVALIQENSHFFDFGTGYVLKNKINC